MMFFKKRKSGKIIFTIKILTNLFFEFEKWLIILASLIQLQNFKPITG